MRQLTGIPKLLHRIFIVAVVLWITVPLYWLGVTSVTPQRFLAGTTRPAMVPREPTMGAYEELLMPHRVAERRGAYDRSSPAPAFRRSMLNSTVVSVSSTLLGMVFGSLAAYALARLRFPLRSVWRSMLLASRMIAPIALAIPLYSVFRRLGILDQYLPLIAVYTSMSMAWATLIMTNYFHMLPKELEDAAMVDGCSRLGTFIRIVVPSATPGLVAVMMITFLYSWGEFLFALLFTSSLRARTLPVIASMFMGEFAVSYNMIAAALILTILPPIVLALVFQRFIVAGLTAGSVKG